LPPPERNRDDSPSARTTGTPVPTSAPHPLSNAVAETQRRPTPERTTLIEQLDPPLSGDPALAAAGDAHAFGRLYHAHAAHVHSLARRMAGDEHADELTQDVFVRCWEKLRTFRGESAFGTWLHRLAVNLILARRAAIATRRARDGGDEALEWTPARRETPELAMDFEAAVQRLPDGARQVFVLFDVEGYRHEELAALMGISTGTSKSQLHRARMILRGHLG
jgi:RNA polymerase sigma-70 factor (ECF subfamily)